jgi:hypothetical protein
MTIPIQTRCDYGDGLQLEEREGFPTRFNALSNIRVRDHLSMRGENQLQGHTYRHQTRLVVDKFVGTKKVGNKSKPPRYFCTHFHRTTVEKATVHTELFLRHRFEPNGSLDVIRVTYKGVDTGNLK